MDLVQIAQHADDLERAAAFRAADATPGPPGTAGCRAWVRDPGGNPVGLVEHRAR